MAKFSEKNFWAFCSALRVDSKERSQITLAPENLLGTQTYLIEEIANGINEGVHHFTILKGRQLGITTICLALDLYWIYKHKGLNGSLVTHDEPTRDDNRATLTMYMDGLPIAWKVPHETHNRSHLVLKNRSKFTYQVAGTRKNTKLGKGKALTFLHSTETSEYGDEEGIASLEASLAQENPNRLFIYETTAQGYNAFYDMWKDAKLSVAKRAIFIGWWRNQFYRKKKGSQEHKVYWDGKLSSEERKWVDEVKRIYNFTIDDEQIAWWRWCLAEVQRDELLMYQNYPPCVTAESRVGTDAGLIKISDARNGMMATKGKVIDTHANQATTIYKMRTSLGYELRGTWEHPIFSAGGVLIPLKSTLGHRIQLCPPRLADSEYTATWSEGVLVSSIKITEEMARFIGIFMGDGSFQIKNPSRNNESGCGVLSVAFDRKDSDFIDSVMQMVFCLFGITPILRQTSEGGMELRASSILLTRIFRNLGLIRNDTGLTMRHVHVPEFIFRSPKNVVKAFLQGIYETDGYNSHNRTNLCSKYPQFLKDIQLLLLSFGITAKLILDRKATATVQGVKHSYSTNYLETRKEETVAFNREIGFLSSRKIAKSIPPKRKDGRGLSSIPLVMEDIVVSVEEDGFEPVYNLTIEGEHSFDANGIHTHNTETYAFIKTGTNFFNIARVNDEMKVAKKLPYKNFRFVLRNEFEDCELNECGEKMGNLKVWDMPVQDAHYVIGADPAYGSSEWADRFAAVVYRCYSDGMDMVAEFNTPDCTTYQFAWVICHLAGAYSMNKGSTCMLNLEINGPGQAVWAEMTNLKRVAANSRSESAKGVLSVVSSIQNFFYKRPDSFGPPSAYHTISSQREKERMFNCFKDGFERGIIKVKSAECIDEMTNVERDDGFLGAPGRGKDDRIVASALATVAWVDYVRMRMVQMGLSRNEAANKVSGGDNVSSMNTVSNYLKKVGIGR